MTDPLFASDLLQAAGACITAGVFGGFYKSYRKGFLREWARSWSALCLALTGAALGQLLAGQLPLDSPVRLAVAAVTVAAAYLQIVWLLFGSGELVGRRDYTPGERHLLLSVAALLGVGLAGVHATDPTGQSVRFLIRTGLTGVIVAFAFFLAASHVWLAPGVRALGRRLVVGALVLYGISQLHPFALGMLASTGTPSAAYSIFIGFAVFVLIFATGLGVVIWLLEEQRAEAAANAAQVERLALHDPLTGLPNRKLFLDLLNAAISQARRAQTRLAVLFIDLDRFKLVNDSLGHPLGDKLLQVVASRIRAVLRESDTVARMGGDEFTVLAPVVNSVEDAIAVARKVRESVKEVVAVEGRELFVTASIGIGMFPDDGIDALTLLKNADAAMYRAKAQGADLFQLYTADMNSHAIEQLALESALRRGVEHLEFLMHYQPIVRVDDGSIACMEAMLRWKHPVLGLVRPEQFIKLAESTGMIVPIGEWALETACRQLAVWRADGFTDLHMAVNLSTRQLQQTGLVDFVRGVLDRYALPPSALELEIGETSASQSKGDAVRQLGELKAMGVGISIDDFGTGYSSLASLRNFPVDVLKIDTSFTRNLVRDPNDTAIAIAITALARSLGLRVVAEGVEHPTQLEFLHAHDCEYWQGYLCSAPVDAGEATIVLRRMRAAGGRILTPVALGALNAG